MLSERYLWLVKSILKTFNVKSLSYVQVVLCECATSNTIHYNILDKILKNKIPLLAQILGRKPNYVMLFSDTVKQREGCARHQSLSSSSLHTRLFLCGGYGESLLHLASGFEEGRQSSSSSSYPSSTSELCRRERRW